MFQMDVVQLMAPCTGTTSGSGYERQLSPNSFCTKQRSWKLTRHIVHQVEKTIIKLEKIERLLYMSGLSYNKEKHCDLKNNISIYYLPIVLPFPHGMVKRVKIDRKNTCSCSSEG